MASATVTAETVRATGGATIDPAEAAHFGKLAADWWNPAGTSAMLHRLNPPRLAYLRGQIDAHWGGDPASFAPLAGRTALDVGCGAGLLCEPLTRLGAAVSGIDAAPENIAAARAHAAAGRLTIDYHAGELHELAGRQFDLVTCLEVIEHVTDQARFVGQLAAAVTPGGLLVLSTPNRTAQSRLAMIAVGEGLGLIPRGTHDWDKFVTPAELGALLAGVGLRVIDTRGLAFSVARGFALSDDVSLDYFVTAVAA